MSSLLEDAAAELESMRVPPYEEESSQSSSDDDTPSSCSTAVSKVNALFEESSVSKFPPNCYKLLQTIPGNSRCVDCDDPHPQWAVVTYGILVCLRCSGRHRSYGVQISKVRSLAMDSWSHTEVLSMLEGGNEQLNRFFQRHSLVPVESSSHEVNVRKLLTYRNNSNDPIIEKRFKTKAAQFYREQLKVHIGRVILNGEYQGREEARRMSTVGNQTINEK